MTSFINSEMDQITEKIWLGNYDASRNKINLKRQGITKILSIMDYAPQFDIEDNVIQKIIEVIDSPTFNIIQYFGECLNFMEGNEKVLVHCWAGASRSATIVIAYIMWKYKTSAEDAINYVLQKRTSILPNSGFQKQLKIFEKLLKDNQYDIDRIDFYNINWNPKLPELSQKNKQLYIY